MWPRRRVHRLLRSAGNANDGPLVILVLEIYTENNLKGGLISIFSISYSSGHLVLLPTHLTEGSLKSTLSLRRTFKSIRFSPPNLSGIIAQPCAHITPPEKEETKSGFCGTGSHCFNSL